MRLRHIPGAAETVTASKAVFDQQRAPGLKGCWREIFANDRPIHVEIGMGRGRFLLASAAAFPAHNFIGLEIREEMIMQALERAETLPSNIRFLWLNAGLLEEIFAEQEIARIYLNFPDPWPKSRHAKRRLTSAPYLKKYKAVLEKDGTVRFKTDKPELFAWSEESFAAGGWELLTFSYDLPLAEAGIVSEYETRYRRLGQPIFFAEWRKPWNTSAPEEKPRP